MKCTLENSLYTIEAKSYKLTLAVPPYTSFLFCKHTSRLFALTAGGDCTVTGKNDNASEISEWRVEELSDGTLRFTRDEKSEIWNSKRFVIEAAEDSLEYYHELEGEGDLEEIRYFRCCCGGDEFGFAGDFDEVYSVAPNFREQKYFHPTSQFLISYGNDLSPVTGAIALPSVPHAAGLHDRRDKGCLAVGVFTEQGGYDWDEFVWNPAAVISPTPYFGDDEYAGGFAIRYYGKKHISGAWTTPRLIMTFPDNYEDTLKNMLEYAYDKGYMPRPEPHKIYSWWKDPIYCTWEDQTAFSNKDNCSLIRKKAVLSRDLCTQEYVDRWIDILIKNDAKPGIVILDDKWQKSKYSYEVDTEKWPDLRKWIDKCHANGIRVFLWGLAWQTEDVPFDEAIVRDGTKIVAADITNPKYEAKMREKIRRYFSDEPDCFNADGVKIDGLLGLPTGRGLKNYKNIWGLELQKYYLKFIHETAKKIKEDVCISVFTANPYLDKYTDVVRLGDMYTSRLSTEESMRWRASVISAAHPYCPIDMDSQPNYCIAPDYLDIFDIQKELGIPTIYNAQYLRRGHYYLKPVYGEVGDDYYKKVSELFREYRKTLNK